MKSIKIGSLVLVAMFASATAQPPAKPPMRDQNQNQNGAAEALKEIQQTFGFVPQFFRAIPSTMLPGFWESMKTFEMNPNTKLDRKTKELIGVAVASQIPCEYCLVFHREGARLQGATEEEIREAVGMAAMTRLGSTLLNGLEVDKAQFKRDVDRIVRNSKQQAKASPQQP